MAKEKLKIVELFAGVGGFRLGFEGEPSKNKRHSFETVFASQWEPSTKNQFAFECYKKNFKGKGISEKYSNIDIAEVPSEQIPKHDILVGGFPCQDYSVAQSGAKGIQGKKGVLWWEIHRIVKQHEPKYVLLENVDRLLKSPTKQRGRDFGIILKTFDEMGYDVEWRVINASEYGEPQRRRRIFIFAIKRELNFYKKNDEMKILYETGFFAPKFGLKKYVSDKYNALHERESFMSKKETILEISDNFDFPFQNSGIAIDGKIFTIKTEPKTLSKKQEENGYISKFIKHCNDENFYLNNAQIAKNKELKGGKSIIRVRPNGEEYKYTEGAMNIYEPLDRAARTMLTSESTINRSSHFILDPENKRPRKITPEEAEQINTFPQGWTNTGMTQRQRYFCMGNALVVNLITKMAKRIEEIEQAK